jgi:hypothetical protein
MASESPRELRRVLRQLADAIGRATRITNQLAAFAESENAQLEFVELNPLLTQFIDQLRKQADHLGIELVAHIDEVASRKFETTRLMPVLDSIAQNAFDAMPGGGRLTDAGAGKALSSGMNGPASGGRPRGTGTASALALGSTRRCSAASGSVMNGERVSLSGGSMPACT